MKTPFIVSRKITRRIALKLFAAGTLGTAFGASSTFLLTRLGVSNAPYSKYQFFSESEANLLTAVCERIIPSDDTPGATDLGVIHFIDRNLLTYLAKHQESYRKGISAIEATSRLLHQKAFVSLSLHQQDDFLRKLESGNVPDTIWTHQKSQAFFALVVAHSMQGFYGPPRHGGNRDYLSYKILDLDYPQVIGQNRY